MPDLLVVAFKIAFLCEDRCVLHAGHRAIDARTLLGESLELSLGASEIAISEQLLRGATTLAIDHAGQRYLLRVTRENKLILTK